VECRARAGLPPSAQHGPTSLDLTLLIALAFLWGSAYIFIREGIVYGASPLLYAAARYVLSAGVFAALALATRERGPARGPLLVSALVGGILVIGLYGGFLYWGEQYTSGGYAAVLSSTAPIFTVLFAFFLLPNERLGPVALAGIALGFVGTIVLVAPSILGDIAGGGAGPLFVIAAFVSAPAGLVLLRRYGGGRQGMWQIASQFAVGGALLLAVGAALPYPERLPATYPVLGALAALVGFASLGGYLVFYTLHHRVGPILANSVTYLLPLVAIGLGSGFFGEPVTIWEVAGFGIVLVGVTLVLRGNAAAPAAPAASTAPAGGARPGAKADNRDRT
jgi:probable blue pigment (indigoidine) exporter